MCGGRLSGAERSRRSHRHTPGRGGGAGRSRPTWGTPGAAVRDRCVAAPRALPRNDPTRVATGRRARPSGALKDDRVGRNGRTLPTYPKSYEPAEFGAERERGV